MELSKTQVDDSNWSTAEIAKVYRRAALFAGYTDEDIARFAESETRYTMLKRLDSFRTNGWVDVAMLDSIEAYGHLRFKKIEFSTLEELSLKLAIRGIF